MFSYLFCSWLLILFCHHVPGFRPPMLLNSSKTLQKFDVFIRDKGRWKFSHSIEELDESTVKMKFLNENADVDPSSISVYPTRWLPMNTIAAIKVIGVAYIAMAVYCFFSINYFYGIVFSICAVTLLRIRWQHRFLSG